MMSMMKKNKLISLVLAIIGATLVIGGLYFVISYLSYLGKGVIDFVSVNNVDTISRCGIIVPDMFLQLRDQFAVTIVPLLYLGIPIAVIILSIIWFASGFYLGKSRVEEDLESKERKKREIEDEIEKRLGGRKPKHRKEEIKGEIEEEEPEEEPEEVETEEEAEEEPVKRRKTKRR